jgi:hypothetical protein
LFCERLPKADLMCSALPRQHHHIAECNHTAKFLARGSELQLISQIQSASTDLHNGIEPHERMLAIQLDKISRLQRLADMPRIFREPRFYRSIEQALYPREVNAKRGPNLHR